MCTNILPDCKNRRQMRWESQYDPDRRTNSWYRENKHFVDSSDKEHIIKII